MSDVTAGAMRPRQSPLHKVHADLGATFTDFAGWDMPVRYTSDLEEHHAVRRSAGLFDLSHMGEIRVTGPDAERYLDHALAGKLSGLTRGRAKYTLLLTPEGTVLDDLILYRLAASAEGDDRDEFLVVANASNVDADWDALSRRAEGFDVELTNESEQTALVAVQGPRSAEIITRALLASTGEARANGFAVQDISDLKYYRCLAGTFDDAPLLLARTGYTGEDGFELYVPIEKAQALWDLLVEAGGDELRPCGLACRDTLRLEAGMPLYGHELSTQTLPAQAGLGRVVALTAKEEFIGREGIENADMTGRRVLVGLAAEGRRAGRAGYPVVTASGETVGEITSGTLSPTLGHPIAMAFVDPQYADEGTELALDVRGKQVPATVVPLPFYRRA
ncbi:glycine cleavage system aminomethyltransferase GcvT [Aestuariimicrobium sp. p3-SID1156]|uniref:glycine cleavage system aminomethyltransferase GcvT n=1 Tax=Aestuariimicrobium sp. p3-SID1156 TaxID=2916038 RepID=UPI00223B6F8D|nr:glycine cleavage system aminomethyltransferase GcvT [Aestuariimicrobium sp. p3-SID1156]MCT1457999.1 glycine cleavage system aminomethyltransferase GcvT [Aestuariimicrobium sp. p3-SID1156]